MLDCCCGELFTPCCRLQQHPVMRPVVLGSDALACWSGEGGKWVLSAEGVGRGREGGRGLLVLHRRSSRAVVELVFA